jgi:hypothetical protein
MELAVRQLHNFADVPKDKCRALLDAVPLAASALLVTRVIRLLAAVAIYRQAPPRAQVRIAPMVYFVVRTAAAPRLLQVRVYPVPSQLFIHAARAAAVVVRRVAARHQMETTTAALAHAAI